MRVYTTVTEAPMLHKPDIPENRKYEYYGMTSCNQ
jgi:hypothetical protein